MFDWILFISVSLIGFGVLTSYFLVFGNVSNMFSLDDYGTTYSYITSPYWMGTSTNNVYSIIVFQLLAVVGYIVWLFWVCSETNFETSLLRYRWSRALIMSLNLIGSVLWPYTTYYYLLSPNLGRALLTCSTLWLSSVCVILMIAGTFEANAPPYATSGILILGTVVVLADGVGWASRCIQNALYYQN
jgi:hypothetical protein